MTLSPSFTLCASLLFLDPYASYAISLFVACLSVILSLQDLLGRVPHARVKTDEAQNGKKRCGCGTILCILLITIIAVAYLALLCVFLIHVATNGK